MKKIYYINHLDEKSTFIFSLLPNRKKKLSSLRLKASLSPSLRFRSEEILQVLLLLLYNCDSGLEAHFMVELSRSSKFFWLIFSIWEVCLLTMLSSEGL